MELLRHGQSIRSVLWAVNLNDVGFQGFRSTLKIIKWNFLKIQALNGFKLALNQKLLDNNDTGPTTDLFVQFAYKYQHLHSSV